MAKFFAVAVEDFIDNRQDGSYVFTKIFRTAEEAQKDVEASVAEDNEQLLKDHTEHGDEGPFEAKEVVWERGGLVGSTQGTGDSDETGDYQTFKLVVVTLAD